jgi:hypothetical protein
MTQFVIEQIGETVVALALGRHNPNIAGPVITKYGKGVDARWASAFLP